MAIRQKKSLRVTIFGSPHKTKSLRKVTQRLNLVYLITKSHNMVNVSIFSVVK